MARKGENIYKRKDGRWEGRYLKERTADGKYRYGSVYGRQYSEVRAKLLPLKLYYQTCKTTTALFQGTVGQWMDNWLELVMKPKLKSSSYCSYRCKIRKYIIPAIGHLPLQRLSSEHVTQFVQKLKREHLSSSTVSSIFRVLHSSIRYAVKSLALHTNPCENIVMAAPQKAQVNALGRQEQRRLLEAAAGHPYGIAVFLALYSGMRIGEICALRWEDVNLEEGYLTVRSTVQRITDTEPSPKKTKIVFGTPKSRRSWRTIPLPETLLHRLEMQKKQAGEYVVTCRNSFAEPRIVSYHFHRMLAAAGLPSIHFHALRHTFATRCLESGVDITTISRFLGHSSAKLTLDIYTDSLAEHQKVSIGKLDHIFTQKRKNCSA